MAQKQGMDPGVARASRDSMRVRIDLLTAIIEDLSATGSAARDPAGWGIEPGEPTIAPWSLGSVASAEASITGAEAAARVLLQRISSEADAQDAASAGDPIFGDSNSVRSVLDTAREHWERGTNPAALISLPFALHLSLSPGVSRWVINPRNWGPAGTVRGADLMAAAARRLRGTGWQGLLRGSYVAGSNIELQNLIDPDYVPSLGRHLSPTAGRWMNVLHVKNPRILSGMRTAISGAGKGFGVLGVVTSALDLGEGVAGMTDGDVSSEDAWGVADGAVGLITGIGSFAPPPVGTVFAAVGAGYSVGRWLFREDENGRTGIDKVGDLGRSAGSTVSTAAGVVGDAAGDAVESVGDFVEDVWPW